MKFDKIIEEMNKGQLVVWKDDGRAEPLNEKYMKDNFVDFAQDMKAAAKLCRDLQDAERDKHGRALTRLRITGTFDDYVCAEDSDEEVEKWINKKNRGV